MLTELVVGSVWQGRFKSPVIPDGMHMLVILRYVEVNPSGLNGFA